MPRTVAGWLLMAVAAVTLNGVAARGAPPPAEPRPAVLSSPGNCPPGQIVATLGPPETLAVAGSKTPRYFPDGCLAMLSTRPAYRMLVAGGISTWLLEGPDLQSLAAQGPQLTRGPPGSFDNGYAGVGGVVRDGASRRLLAFYHAEDQEGLRPIPGGIPGFYCSVALAVSADEGRTFQKLGPVITSSRPKDPHSSRSDQGCGECGIVADGDPDFVLAYYGDHSHVNGPGVQIAVARCRRDQLLQTDAWRKYDRGGFTEPGRGGHETPVLSAAAEPGDALFPQVTFVPAWRAYVMVFNVHAWRDTSAAAPTSSGIYAAYSRDGLSWSKATRLLQIGSLPILDREMGCHATLLLTAASGSRAGGWLLYAYSPRWGHRPPQQPHYLVGRPMALELTPDGTGR